MWNRIKAFLGISSREQPATVPDVVSPAQPVAESPVSDAPDPRVGPFPEIPAPAPKSATSTPRINTDDAWSAAFQKHLDGVMPDRVADWEDMLRHCRTATASKPSARWLAHAKEKMAALPPAAWMDAGLAALAAIGETGRYDSSTRLTDEYTDLFRGIIWSLAVTSEPRSVSNLGSAAEKAFQKVKDYGPRNVKVGNACLFVLGHVGSMEAIAQLSRLKTRVKTPSLLKQIDKTMTACAAAQGIGVDELEEIAVPTFGMTDVGTLKRTIGPAVAELRVFPGNRVDVRWLKSAESAKSQASAPSGLKDTHAPELKAFTGLVKELEKMLPALQARLESLMRLQRSWPLAAWRTRYLDHPLTGTLARRLVWRIKQGNDTGRLAAWDGVHLVDAMDQPVEVPSDATISLWHPIDSPAEEVNAWREWLQRHEVVQPFKQAHREIYVLTDAERRTDTYSNRFAAHILKQHQLHALCRQRGWKYTLQGAWDCADVPTFDDPVLGWKATYAVEVVVPPQQAIGPTGIFLHVSTDQVRFYPAGEREHVPLTRVPPRIFSELMRDVDLFVGVCSIANDPQWTDRGPEGQHANYWQGYSFGELSATAQTRRDVLRRILPRLKIADRCSVEDRFLVVRGDKRTYKIHLGSGNILMEPNDQYLCIVQERNDMGKDQPPIFLPFEGDRTLALILSKTFLLADDLNIKDPTITRQIGSKP